MTKVLVVGGVAGGASTVARLRRMDEHAEIILFERGEHVSYANCGLPYYVGGVIRERNALFQKTPAKMGTEFKADVRVFSDVTAVNPAAKQITVISRDRGEYTEHYDYLVLAPGAKPIRPAIEGSDDERIVSIRDVPNADAAFVLARRPEAKRAVVVGGGFIGVEMAENLRHLGLTVSLVEMAPHILAPLDDDMVAFPEREFVKNGVNLFLNDKALRFEKNGESLRVVLESGTGLDADIVVLALGVRPDTAFLAGSGIATGPAGHILVNPRMQTNFPEIYAVGDAIAFSEAPQGHGPVPHPLAVPLAGPANRQGRIAADNIAGRHAEYAGFQGTSVVKVFDITVAATGVNERALIKAGIPYRVAVVHPGDHAGYYPGATPMTLKLLFNEEGRIFGAQGAGKQGVDKRIDVLATVMRLNGTVHDLSDLELAYAPPYSAAKDPVNLLGYVAENMLEGLVKAVSFEEYTAEWAGREHVLLDVRTSEEYARNHLPGSLHIPLDDLRDRIGEIPPGVPVFSLCLVGRRGYVAARILEQSGHDVYLMRGGCMSIWGHDADKPECLRGGTCAGN